MARAKRHYTLATSGISLIDAANENSSSNFSEARHRYWQWLYQARKRYGLTVLAYMVTSNPIHLLGVDDGDRVVITKNFQPSNSSQSFP